MRALLVFVLASLPYVALAQEVNQVSAEGSGRYSITMNASGSLSILLDTTTGKTWRIFIEEDKSLAWRPAGHDRSPSESALPRGYSRLGEYSF
jgi:hypothetical protein